MTELVYFVWCVGIGVISLLLLTLFFGNDFPDFELPFLGRVPLTLMIALSVGFYGGLGLMVSSVMGTLWGSAASVSPGLHWLLAVVAIVASYYASRSFSQLFVDRPQQPLFGYIVGSGVTIRFAPGRESSEHIGDAIAISDSGSNVVIRVVLAEDAHEPLASGDVARVIAYDPDRGWYVVVKFNSLDDLEWQRFLPPGTNSF